MFFRHTRFVLKRKQDKREALSRAIAVTAADVDEMAKRDELYKFAVIPKRWVVERPFLARHFVIIHGVPADLLRKDLSLP